jgi:hypothetical protein
MASIVLIDQQQNIFVRHANSDLMVTRITLIVLVLFGLWGAGGLSYDQYQTGDACPILGNTIPACYVALAGYVLIGLGVVLSLALGSSTGIWAFWTGTAIAGGLAALATVLELIKGAVCPVAFGSIPTCYLSLALSVVIGGLFWGMTRRT